MTVYDTLYFFFMAMVLGSLMGLFWSIVFHWVKWID